MSSDLKSLPQLKSDYGFGEIFKANIINTSKLIDTYAEHLIGQHSYIKEYFDYNNLQFEQNHIVYNQIKAKKIIFCEGAGVVKNPFFKNLPIKGNKGEYIVIKAPDLKINFILKSTFSLIPLEKDLYKFGATYDREFQNAKPEEKNRELLLEKLDELIDCSYEIVKAAVGIRPTVPDHRPIVGRHPKNPKLLICNGLGSHGVMRASSMAKQLLAKELHNEPLCPEIDLYRYFKE